MLELAEIAKERGLAPNVFNPIPLIYRVNEKLEGTAYFLIRDQEVDLRECEIGNGYIIKKPFLHAVDPDLDWKWVRHPGKLEPDLIKKLVNSQIKEAPKTYFSGSFLPTLSLTDPRGCFANLGDLDWEEDLLEAGYQIKPTDNTRYFCPPDKVYDTLNFLLELGWEIQTKEGSTLTLCENINLEMIDGDEIQVKGKLTYGEHEVDIEKTIASKHFVPITDGVMGLIPQTGEITTLANEGTRIKRARFGVLEDLFSEPILTFEKTPPADTFNGSLRPYQQTGVDWLHALYRQRFSGLLADDMGLGKTVQTLAFLSTLPGPHLIVMPTTLLFNWKQEIERFLGITPTVYHGKERAKPTGLTLTTYGTLRNDIETLQNTAFNCVILDEAQAIKNSSSQTARAACRLNSKFRLSVTGTPVENRWDELLSQFAFLIPDLLEAPFDEKQLKRVRPYLLRRTKEKVAKDLPEKIEQVVTIDMEEGQETIYQDILKATKSKTHQMEILEGILRLRQLLCHPILIQHKLETDASLESPKFKAILSDIKTLVQEGKKLLVYSQFTSFLTLIGNALEVPFLRLDGSTKNREETVQAFQEGETQVFLISLKAGGVGLNLTAADYVLLSDPWWNEAAEAQAIDRAHRIGRQGTVIAKRYIMKDTIEEKMMELKASKKSLGEQIEALFY